MATGPRADGETRIRAPGVSWDFYERFVDGLPERSGVRTAYDGEDMEVLVKGPLHEDFRALPGRFVEEVATESGAAFLGLGETTWKRRDAGRGLEADQCYFFEPAKVAQARAALGRRENDVAAYPDPDLAVEVDISPPLIDRPAIYAALGVPEVWRFDGATVRIERLTPAGAYEPAPRSRWLPVAADDVLAWITAEDAHDRGAWARRLRAWAAGLRG